MVVTERVLNASGTVTEPTVGPGLCRPGAITRPAGATSVRLRCRVGDVGALVLEVDDLIVLAKAVHHPALNTVVVVVDRAPGAGVGCGSLRQHVEDVYEARTTVHAADRVLAQA
jgi:hypothetical protein